MTEFKYTILGKILSVIIPALRDQAKESFNKLPKEKQEQLKETALMVQIVKLGFEQKLPVATIINQLVNQTGLTAADIETRFIAYWSQNGQSVGSLQEAIKLIIGDASQRTVTGLKSLWSGIANLMADIVTNIDWQALLMGLIEYTYRTFIKGKVKV